MTVLGRDDFRRAVFARGGERCVLCRAPAQDAHHIIAALKKKLAALEKLRFE